MKRKLQNVKQLQKYYTIGIYLEYTSNIPGTLQLLSVLDNELGHLSGISNEIISQGSQNLPDYGKGEYPHSVLKHLWCSVCRKSAYTSCDLIGQEINK